MWRRSGFIWVYFHVILLSGSILFFSQERARPSPDSLGWPCCEEKERAAPKSCLRFSTDMQPTVDGPFKRGPGGDGGWVVLQKQKKAAAREDFVCVWVLSQVGGVFCTDF